MPSPVYMICAELAAEDAQKHVISLFNILERVNLQRLKDQPAIGGGLIRVASALPFEAISVWTYEEGDDTKGQYEGQFVIKPPAGGDQTLATPPFAFNKEKRLVRFRLQADIPMTGPGVITVEHRIRRKGSNDDWWSQKYSFDAVDVTPSAASDAPAITSPLPQADAD